MSLGVAVACLTLLGGGTASALPPPVCPGDTNGDGVVNFQDVSTTLANWGGGGPAGDGSGDCAVSFADINLILVNFGKSCPMPRLEAPGNYFGSIVSVGGAQEDGVPPTPSDAWERELNRINQYLEMCRSAPKPWAYKNTSNPGCPFGAIWVQRPVPVPSYEEWAGLNTPPIIIEPDLPPIITPLACYDQRVRTPSFVPDPLQFQTDGPIICQALFQRLAPRAPLYGAQINYAGDRLEIYFDPAYSITQDGGYPSGGGCYFPPPFFLPGLDDTPWTTDFHPGIEDPTSAPGCDCDPEPPASDSWDFWRSPFPGVLAHSGETVLCSVDFAIPGRGLDLVWARTYRSRLSPEGARLGHGWDHSYNVFVEACGSDLVLHDGGGRADRYFRQPDGSWTCPEFFRVITRNPDQSFTLTLRHGTKWNLRALDGSPAQGRVSSVVDRNNNTMTFSYDGLGRLVSIQDTLHNPPNSPRVLSIAYNADGRIAGVTDWAGRQVVYEYYGPADPDGAPGDLKSVRSPVIVSNADFPIPPGHEFPAGLTTVYTYTRGFADDRLNHNLLSITDPRGGRYWSAQYAATTNASDLLFDRCVRMTVGAQGPAGDNIDLHYVIVNPAAPPNAARLKAIVNDRMGNVREYSYDALNRVVRVEAFTGRAPDPDAPTTDVVNRPVNPLRPTDPPSFVTTFEHNADSRLTRVVRPELDEVLVAYDSGNPARRSQGNVLSITRLPGPRGAAQPMLSASATYEPAHNMALSATDPLGNTTQYQYDASGNCVRTIHRIPSIVVDREYNSFGQLTAVVWPDNGSGHRRRDTMLYYGPADGYGNGYLRRLTVDATALALVHLFEYDRVGNLIRSIDPTGGDSLRTVDQLNRTVLLRSREVALALGLRRYAREFFHDANGNVVRAETDNIDGQGNVGVPSRFVALAFWDELNRLTRLERTVDAVRTAAREYAYDANGNLVRIRFGEAVNGNNPFNTISCEYDERDLVFKVIRAPLHPVQCTTRLDYDRNGNAVRSAHGTEGTPREAVCSYDGYDRIIVKWDPMGNRMVYDYDGNSNVVLQASFGELIDVLPGSAGNVRLSETRYSYDAMDRVIREEASFFDPSSGVPFPGDPRTRQVAYSDMGGMTAMTDSFGRVATYTYDTACRPARATDPRGNSTLYEYDARSNVIRATRIEASDLDASQTLTLVHSRTWDSLDRCTSATGNDGSVVRYVYDSRDNLVETIDPRGNRTNYIYDGLSRLVREERILTDTGDGGGTPIGAAVVSRTYDDSSRLRSITDPNGNTTRYAYDARDRRIVTQPADGTLNQVGTGATWPLGNPDPDLSSFQNGYDLFGNPVVTVDARGNRIDAVYDALDRCTARNITRAPGVLGTTNETYQYDGLSRLVRAQDDDSVVSRAYDSLSNLLRETQQVVPHPVRTVQHTYNVEGERLSTVYPGGRTVNRLFDVLSRVRSISDTVFGHIASYFYLGPARLERRQCANDTELRLVYDLAERPIGVHHQQTSTSQPIVHLNSLFDPAGNRLVADEPTAMPPPYAKQYAYDSLDRLIRTQVMDGPNPPQVTQYQLDHAGNRVLVNGPVDPGPYFMDPTWPVPADRQMNQYTQTSFDQRQYDDGGHLTLTQAGPTIRSFAYDYRGRLVQYVSGAVNATYLYDALGRRIQKSGAGVTTARYYYDGSRLIEEQSAANSTVQTYVHGPDGPVQYLRGAVRRYFHADDLGSVRAVTDQAGNVQERYRYEDFGKPSFFNAVGNPIPNTQVFNPFSFHGRFYDAESTLLQGLGQYLDPRAGRIIAGGAARGQVDIPIEIISLGLTSARPPGYSENNPVSCQDRTDPPGICGTPWTWPDPSDPYRTWRWRAVSDGWRNPWWRSPMVVAAEWIEMGWLFRMHWDEVRDRIRRMQYDKDPRWHKEILEGLERDINEAEERQREMLRQSA